MDSTKFTELSLQRCLEFLYTGYVDLKKDSEGLEDTLKAAWLFNLPELQLIVENAQKEEEFLNPSIGTWLNDRNSNTAKQLFLNKVTIFNTWILNCSYQIRCLINGENVILLLRQP